MSYTSQQNCNHKKCFKEDFVYVLYVLLTFIIQALINQSAILKIT